jgi:hypothetical protein
MKKQSHLERHIFLDDTTILTASKNCHFGAHIGFESLVFVGVDAW